VAADVPGSSVAAEGSYVIGPHNPSHTMFVTGLAGFAQIKKDPPNGRRHRAEQGNKAT